MTYTSGIGAWFWRGGSALFEFSIEAVILGERDNSDEWPPRYTSWTAP